MNYLYIPELDNMALNMDTISKIYIHGNKLYMLFIGEDSASWHRIDCSIKDVQYRLDMFFLNKVK